MKNILPSDKEHWGKWAAVNDNWDIIDADFELSVLCDRMKKWEIIPEKDGETIPLGIKKSWSIIRIPEDGEFGGCGGCHYEYKTGGTLDW